MQSAMTCIRRLTWEPANVISYISPTHTLNHKCIAAPPLITFIFTPGNANKTEKQLLTNFRRKTVLQYNKKEDKGKSWSWDDQSPYERFNGWVQYTRQQEEWCDQDVEEWERSEGHSGRESSVCRAVYIGMYYKRLRRHSNMPIGHMC